MQAFAIHTRRAEGSVIADNFAAFDQVCEEPLIPVNLFRILPIFWIPLQHLPHKGEKQLLLLAFQYLFEKL
jgi:hypothetical protein